MHLLSERNRSEFLAVPELVRFTMADGSNGPEATLLIKTSTLSLKYLLRQKRIRAMLVRVGENWLAYGIQIDDDPIHPAVLWSLLEYPDEFDALRTLSKRPMCAIFLFNELAVNVADGEAEIDCSAKQVGDLLNSVELHPIEDTTASTLAGESISGLLLDEQGFKNGYFVDLQKVPAWRSVESYYITNRLSKSLISIFETDEGRQQEELALWLVDNLNPAGAVRSPQIEEPNKTRELSDVLLTYERGSFLIESKTLNILSRQTLPSRKKLQRDVLKHLAKASRQLIGGMKNLRKGYKVTDLEGREFRVELTNPPHVIVLVPDLSLLSEATDYNGEFFRKASAECGGFFHILDISELMRVAQAAEMLSRAGKSTTPMMAFDYYLIRRMQHALSVTTPNFEVLLRIQDDGTT